MKRVLGSLPVSVLFMAYRIVRRSPSLYLRLSFIDQAVKGGG
jgi:hypothetical protein